MNQSQKDFILVLRTALQHKKFDCSHLSTKRFYKLYDYAQQNKLESFIFSSLSHLEHLPSNTHSLIHTWQHQMIMHSLHQKKHILETERILSCFNEHHLTVIPLKGIYLRHLYPLPELRTMSDLDLYVHLEDIPAIKSCLVTLGYQELPDHHGYHTVFYHPDHLNIEVHWALTNPKSFHREAVQAFEEQLFSHAYSAQVGHTPSLCFSLEDQLIYLCLHMAKHFKYKGFGFRQICDFYLFITCYSHQLNWALLYNLLQNMGLYSFFSMLLVVCHNLLHLSLPNSASIPSTISSASQRFFIKELFNSGTLGNASYSHGVSTLMLHLAENTYHPSKHSLYYFIFPPLSKIQKRYPYCQHFPFLIPLAYIQNGGFLLVRKDIAFSQKLKVLLFATYNKKKRQQLFQQLQLQNDDNQIEQA